MYATVGPGAGPELRAGLGGQGLTLGTLVRVQPNGRRAVAADVSAFEAAANPDQGAPEQAGIDSNPYGVPAEAGRRYVTDAGGNSPVEVRTDGAIGLVAVYPNRGVFAAGGEVLRVAR